MKEQKGGRVGGSLDWMFAWSVCLSAWKLTREEGECVVKEGCSDFVRKGDRALVLALISLRMRIKSIYCAFRAEIRIARCSHRRP